MHAYNSLTKREGEDSTMTLKKMHQIRNIIFPKYNHRETGTDYRQTITPR